jgi:hypothetical protein
MSEHASVLSEFSRTIWAKLLGVLTAIMMMLGIYIEVITAWRSTSEGMSTQAVAREAALRQEAERREKQALAEKADADRRTAEAIANESRLRQEAERREKQALAEKADADRINAESIARESALRQEAERREKQAVADLAAIKAQNAPQREKGEAEKLEGEGKNAQATGKYADARQAAEARKADEEARNLNLKNQILGAAVGNDGRVDPRKYLNNQLEMADRLSGPNSIGYGIRARENPTTASPPEFVQRSFNESLDSVIGGTGGRSAAPTTAAERDRKIVENCKRRLDTFNELKDHAAFAMSALGGCAFAGERPSIEEAIQYVMQQCANARVRTCKIVATK